MDEPAILRIERSFRLITPRGVELIDRFYAILLSRNPAMRRMFPAALKDQKRRLLATIVLIVKSLRRPASLQAALTALGARHAHYGCVEQHYEMFREALIDVLHEMIGESWDAQLETDWREVIGFVSGVMIDGQRRAQLAVG